MQTAVFMPLQYYHNMLPKAFDNNYFTFIVSKHNYNTRLAAKSTYYIDQVRTNYGKFNLRFSGPSILSGTSWTTLHLFKQNLTKQFLNSYG